MPNWQATLGSRQLGIKIPCYSFYLTNSPQNIMMWYCQIFYWTTRPQNIMMWYCNRLLGVDCASMKKDAWNLLVNLPANQNCCNIPNQGEEHFFSYWSQLSPPSLCWQIIPTCPGSCNNVVVFLLILDGNGVQLERKMYVIGIHIRYELSKELAEKNCPSRHDYPLRN